MARYRFHATNGYECVFDAQGREIRVPARLLRRADEVAREIMSSLADREDWSDWHVTVHDLRGRRVLTTPFMPDAADPDSRRAITSSGNDRAPRADPAHLPRSSGGLRLGLS